MAKRKQTLVFTIPTTNGQQGHNLKWEMDADGNHRLVDLDKSISGNWADYAGIARLENDFNWMILSDYWLGVLPVEQPLIVMVPGHMTKQEIQ